MKHLNLKLSACTPCPYYKNELVIKESGKGYDNLHACKLSARGIIYADKITHNNDPEEVIPSWCELPDEAKENKNDLHETSTEKEEGLP